MCLPWHPCKGRWIFLLLGRYYMVQSGRQGTLDSIPKHFSQPELSGHERRGPRWSGEEFRRWASFGKWQGPIQRYITESNRRLSLRFIYHASAGYMRLAQDQGASEPNTGRLRPGSRDDCFRAGAAQFLCPDLVARHYFPSASESPEQLLPGHGMPGLNLFSAESGPVPRIKIQEPSGPCRPGFRRMQEVPTGLGAAGYGGAPDTVRSPSSAARGREGSPMSS